MSFAKNALDNEIYKKKIWRGISIFFGFLLVLGMLVHQSRLHDITVHIPPELSSAVVQKAEHIPRPNVYLFTANILQALNNWDKNGEEDFKRNIEAYRNYLTPRFQEQLLSLYESKKRKGELSERVRGVQEMFGHQYSEERVRKLAVNVWQVDIDLNVREWYRGMNVKDVNLSFPVRVVRYDINRQLNPWGMALDGLIGLPKRLESNSNDHHAEMAKN